MKLEESFYQRKNVVEVARDLLGKELLTKINRKITGGIIVETEAYSFTERGCHAYNNKKTKRNEVMFEPGGVSYVYLCYGIHHLFNVVTNQSGLADAVLIRAIEPTQGQSIMLNRCNQKSINHLTSGPGKLTKALGILRDHNGTDLLGNTVWIDDIGYKLKPTQIRASARIGIDYAGSDAKLPWRFTIKNNPWISKPV